MNETENTFHFMLPPGGRFKLDPVDPASPRLEDVCTRNEGRWIYTDPEVVGAACCFYWSKALVNTTLPFDLVYNQSIIFDKVGDGVKPEKYTIEEYNEEKAKKGV